MAIPPGNSALKVALSYTGIALTLLLLGLCYYLAFRTVLPAPFERLHLTPLSLAGRVGGGAFLGWLPSLIHVTAFGLLTCVVLRPSVLSAIVAGAAWAGIDLLWEFSCADHQALLHFGGTLIGVDSVPACTYDVGDIAASIAGAVAVVCIAWLVLKVNSISPSTAQERRT